jgi:hypothetical protein
MIEIPRHHKYEQWSMHSYKNDKLPCVICGRPVNIKTVKSRVYMDNSGEDLLSIEEAAQHPEQYEELGMFPIGPDCVQQHPELQGYVVSE